MRYFNVMILGPTQSPYEGIFFLNNVEMIIQNYDFLLIIILFFPFNVLALNFHVEEKSCEMG